MINSNKGKLYSTFIIAVLILALGATVLLGENKQAKLKEENLKIAEKITESYNKGGSKTDEKDSTTSPENISDKNEDEEERLVYSTENINVRSGPGTNYSILGSLLANQRVPLIEKRSDGWSKILFNGKEAYCSSSYLAEEEI